MISSSSSEGSCNNSSLISSKSGKGVMMMDAWIDWCSMLTRLCELFADVTSLEVTEASGKRRIEWRSKGLVERRGRILFVTVVFSKLYTLRGWLLLEDTQCSLGWRCIAGKSFSITVRWCVLGSKSEWKLNNLQERGETSKVARWRRRREGNCLGGRWLEAVMCCRTTSSLQCI